MSRATLYINCPITGLKSRAWVEKHNSPDTGDLGAHVFKTRQDITVNIRSLEKINSLAVSVLIENGYDLDGVTAEFSLYELWAFKDIPGEIQDTLGDEYILYGATWPIWTGVIHRIRPDNCQVCKGNRGGVRGNENRVNGVVMCDYCTAELMKTPPPRQ